MTLAHFYGVVGLPRPIVDYPNTHWRQSRGKPSSRDARISKHDCHLHGSDDDDDDNSGNCRMVHGLVVVVVVVVLLLMIAGRGVVERMK